MIGGKLFMTAGNLTDPANLAAAIREFRGQRVILDSDLADMFGVETRRLNEQVKRNSQRFGPRYAFQLSDEETRVLKSQFATSNEGRGGRRTLPWVFTEHGVVMAATVLSSERAIQATELIIDVFVDVRRRVAAGGPFRIGGGARDYPFHDGGDPWSALVLDVRLALRETLASQRILTPRGCGQYRQTATPETTKLMAR